MTTKQMLSPKEVGAILGKHPSTIRIWIKAGILKATKPTRSSILIPWPQVISTKNGARRRSR